MCYPRESRVRTRNGFPPKVEELQKSMKSLSKSTSRSETLRTIKRKVPTPSFGSKPGRWGVAGLWNRVRALVAPCFHPRQEHGSRFGEVLLPFISGQLPQRLAESFVPERHLEQVAKLVVRSAGP